MVALLLLLSLALAAPAAAAPVSGSGSDPAGDAPAPGLDITAVEASYDAESGALEVAVTLAGPPPGGGDGFLGAVFGPPAAAAQDQFGCGEPFAVIGALTDPAATEAVWQRSDRSYDDAATKAQSGAKITLSDTSVLLAGEPWTCVGVSSQAGATSVDRLDTPLALEPPPPPLTRKQKLRRALRRCAELPRKRRPGCQRKARARYGEMKPAPRHEPPPAPSKGGLAGSIFTWPGVDVAYVCGGTCWEALAFTGGRFVHVGIPDTTAIPRCTRVTYDKERDLGCRPYRLSRDGRTVSVGGKRWRLNRARNKLTPAGEGSNLFRSPFPRPRSRYKAALTSISTFGIFPNATVSTTYLTLDRRGRFALSGSIAGSIGAPGAIETHFAGSSAEQRGRYEFLPGGTLLLRYEDGTVRREAAFIVPGRGRVRLGDGLYLGGRTYLPPDDDD